MTQCKSCQGPVEEVYMSREYDKICKKCATCSTCQKQHISQISVSTHKDWLF